MNRFFPPSLLHLKCAQSEALVRHLPLDRPKAVELFDARALSRRAALLKAGFVPEEQGGQPTYAMKANPERPILEAVVHGGIDSIDCASPFEIDSARNFVSGERLLYTHPVRFPWQILHAMEQGVRYFTVQSVKEAQKIWNLAEGTGFEEELEIVARVFSMGGAKIPLSTKFGCSLDEAHSIIRWVESRTSAKTGISTHTGSQNTDLTSFNRVIHDFASFAKDLGGIDGFNIGGGIPVDYEGMGELPSFEAHLDVIRSALLRHCKDFFGVQREPRFLSEVGRALVAPSTTLAVPVIDVDERGGQKRVYMADGVFGSFSDSVVHKWSYVFNVLRPGTGWVGGGSEAVQLFGQTCDSGDHLGQVVLPKTIQEGDWLVVANAGAYMSIQGGTFNGFSKPKFININPIKNARSSCQGHERADASAA